MKGVYERLAEVQRRGGSVAVATVIRTRGSVPRHVGSKLLVFLDGHTEGTIGGGELEGRVVAEAQRALADGVPRTLVYNLADPGEGDPGVCGGEIEVFVEPVRPEATLVVVGGGHVGKAVAHLARWLGFRVIVCDDRPEFATPEAVPDADAHIACDLAELPSRWEIDDRTYLVLATRNVTVDSAGLPSLLATPAAYIGVIGSRRRWETTAQHLREQGVAPEQIARVVSPIGLELNAETPEEIAVSILAQIIQLRRGGSGQAMRNSPSAGPTEGTVLES